MFGQDILWQDKTQYLGVFIDKKLSFISHIDCIAAKMSIKNKLLLYRTIIRPTISYASAAWSYNFIV